ncbi:hypothetical protein [Gelidibacter mesophilus]|uniref:hypothetical protein n=1 Tax=Gelidibacter mesophilus TaxID=169050 RepID=UPI00041CE300|nr:hypothetical protein [Gelidibacter mesophilus]
MVLRKLLILLLITYIPLLFAQEEKVYFDDALAQHLKKFNVKSDFAIKNDTPNEVDILFDSLLIKHLKNTYISDLKLSKVSGGNLQTAKIERPFLLITKNSAIIQTKEEIKTINALADIYRGKVDIIVLYWNTKSIAKKKSKNYNKNVIVTYADERHNISNNALAVYKHSFGVPACFYINENKQISSIDRKFFLKNIETSTKTMFVDKANQEIYQMLSSENSNSQISLSTHNR